MKLAICGASGIGKHHAKWFKHEGAEVVAFLGQSNEKNRLTSKTLTDLMGFNGRSYTAIDTMLSTERPDAVVICTPPETHAFFARNLWKMVLMSYVKNHSYGTIKLSKKIYPKHEH